MCPKFPTCFNLPLGCPAHLNLEWTPLPRAILFHFNFVLFCLLNFTVLSTSVSGAAVDRYEGDRRNTAVINLLEEDYEYEEEYSDEEYEDGLSGDYEMPRGNRDVHQTKDPSASLDVDRTQGTRKHGKGRKKGKGKGQKRNPCLKKYKDFCIHGTCQYLRDIRAPSCVCHQWYSGERCQFFTLPVEKPQEGYNRTTALAVIAVVLSSSGLSDQRFCYGYRFHKRGAYDVESEEKVKLGLPSNH
uniref:Proheparin-binding EGF-like growth factor n=1 Tax=Neogobius melanostomus TaxID=47308 RepID=A0A8C6THB8_9GOBI